MVCAVNKIDSNVTGLRYAEEICLKQLPNVADDGVDPVFYPLEPNSYSDFGGQITTKARNPINTSRQQKKGVVTDLTASGGFTQDVTQSNLLRLMQGFMFADAREKADSQPLNGTAVVISSVDGTAKTITLASNIAAIGANTLLLASGFALGGNNGLRLVTSNTTGVLVVDTAVTEASPPATARVQAVGVQGAAADLAIAYTAGSFPRLTSTALDFTTLGLIPGEWIYLGGDATGNSFANNSGFARINAIGAHFLEFDKTYWTPVTEAGTGKSVRIFTGVVIRNENDPALIVRRSYDLERTLGNDADGVMSEHLIGSIANEFTLNYKQGDIVTADLTFMACDNTQRTGAQGLVTGDRPSLVETDAFNSVSDFARIKLSSVDPINSAPVPLFAFATDMTITIKNNASMDKALGVLGAFDISVGTFEVGGSITAYFADVLGPQAVRNNADITVDVAMVKNNSGVLIDIPLLTLGNGRLTVEQDKAIMLPLDVNGAQSKFGNTMLFQSFAYLPSKANS